MCFFVLLVTSPSLRCSYSCPPIQYFFWLEFVVADSWSVENEGQESKGEVKGDMFLKGEEWNEL